jgi:hypothetical protein
MKLSILYRGPLASCNYCCAYCPFVKHAESVAEHQADRHALERFVGWVAGREGDRISVFFTPWGEALIWQRYQQALVRLSHMPHVEKAAIQTNLSGSMAWVDDCDKRRLALWATYHPAQVPRARFVARCRELDRRGVRFSAGVVGMRAHLAEIEALRRELPAHVYLWVNAYKRVPNYYTERDLRRLQAVDPLFPINNQRHPSLGRACRCGQSVIAVDGAGVVRRCHFIREPLGNIYEPGVEAALQEQLCTNMTCGCHIGYVHMDDLGLYDLFGAGVLERIPAKPIWR